jgi:hypothetical protein
MNNDALVAALGMDAVAAVHGYRLHVISEAERRGLTDQRGAPWRPDDGVAELVGRLQRGQSRLGPILSTFSTFSYFGHIQPPAWAEPGPAQLAVPGLIGSTGLPY